MSHASKDHRVRRGSGRGALEASAVIGFCLVAACSSEEPPVESGKFPTGIGGYVAPVAGIGAGIGGTAPVTAGAAAIGSTAGKSGLGAAGSASLPPAGGVAGQAQDVYRGPGRAYVCVVA